MPPVAKVIDGTLGSLRRYRLTLQHLEETIALVHSCGLPTDEMGQNAGRLKNTWIRLRVPCVLCQREYPVDVPVDDPQGNSEPHRVLCQTCSDATDEEVAQWRAEAEKRI